MEDTACFLAYPYTNGVEFWPVLLQNGRNFVLVSYNEIIAHPHAIKLAGNRKERSRLNIQQED